MVQHQRKKRRCRLSVGHVSEVKLKNAFQHIVDADKYCWISLIRDPRTVKLIESRKYTGRCQGPGGVAGWGGERERDLMGTVQLRQMGKSGRWMMATVYNKVSIT